MLSPEETHQFETCIKELKTKGFFIIPNYISEEACDKLKSICNDCYDKFSPLYPSSTKQEVFHGDSRVKMLYNTHNKSGEFLKYIFDPFVLKVANALLSEGSFQNNEPFQVHLTSARGLYGQHRKQQLHIDSPLPITSHVLKLQALWALDPFTDSNGATRIVPNSKECGFYAENGKTYPDETVITCPRGSLILMDASVWHGSSEKKDHSERWLLINSYSRWFIRPSFNNSKNLPNKVFESLTDYQRSLLGLKYNSPDDEFTRLSRIAPEYEHTKNYRLPVVL